MVHVFFTYHQFVVKTDGASHPVLTCSIEYNPSSLNQLLDIVKLDRELLVYRHKSILMVYTLTVLIVDVIIMAFATISAVLPLIFA